MDHVYNWRVPLLYFGIRIFVVFEKIFGSFDGCCNPRKIIKNGTPNIFIYIPKVPDNNCIRIYLTSTATLRMFLTNTEILIKQQRCQMREYITCYFQERTIRFGFSLFLGSTEFCNYRIILGFHYNNDDYDDDDDKDHCHHQLSTPKKNNNNK